MFSRNSTEGRLLAIYDVLYTEAPRQSFQEMTSIVAREASAWSTAQFAGGFGRVMAAAATPPETIDRDLAVLRVDNALDELSIYSRTVNELRRVGLSEEVMTKIDGDLRAVTGGNIPGK